MLKPLSLSLSLSPNRFCLGFLAKHRTRRCFPLLGTTGGNPRFTTSHRTLQFRLTAVHALMDNDEPVALPFEVGQMTESRSFMKGFRGAWFQCKIKEIGLRKGQMGHQLEYVDFPDERIKWTQLYQKPGKSRELKKQLMVRPQFPRIYRESQMPDVSTILEVAVIVVDSWQVGNLVDWWTDGCYWSGRVVELLGDNKVKVELFPPPMGEGQSYEALCKDLRPSLDWTPECGWTVPIPLENGNVHFCARIIKPFNQGAPGNMMARDDDKGREGVQAAARASLERNTSSSSHISGSLSQSPDGFERMAKRPWSIKASKDTRTSETNFELDMVDTGIGKTSGSDSVSSSHVRDAPTDTVGTAAGKGKNNDAGSSKKMKHGSISLNSMRSDTVEDAVMDLEELLNKITAMMKFRLMDSKRWRIIEVELEHNHLISSKSGKFYKSHKHLGVGTKRTLQLDGTEEVPKVRLFRTVVINAEDNGSIDVDEGEFGNNVDYGNQLKLKEGDAQALLNYFCCSQLMDPNFFYVIDLNDKGCLKNLFWTDARARVAYGYFGDVVAFDTTCMTNKYEVPLVSFVGVNHHGQSLLLGCGLLAGETIESYTWLFRAWLTCMLGRPPQAIITDQCPTLQTAVSDVFPRASHCLCLSHIMQKVPEKLGGLFQYESIQALLSTAVYYSVRSEEFEAAWEDMMQHHGLRDHKWLQALYEDRKRWVPVYLKETFLAGMFPIQPSDGVSSFFEEYIDKQTPLKEFLDKYDQILQTKHQLESLADMDSRNSSYMLKSRSYFELQLSKLYTNDILMMFKREVEGMYSCFSTRQLNVDGPIFTYIFKEQVEVEGNRRETMYEVLYNAPEMEVLCACGLFNFKGYLCRHALSVLDQNGIEEIPPQYILSRWRKDIKRSYILDHSSSGIDSNNPVHRHDHLYKCVVQVVEEGRKSQDRYKFALQAMEELLNKLHLVGDQPM